LIKKKQKIKDKGYTTPLSGSYGRRLCKVNWAFIADTLKLYVAVLKYCPRIINVEVTVAQKLNQGTSRQSGCIRCPNDFSQAGIGWPFFWFFLPAQLKTVRTGQAKKNISILQIFI